MASSRGDDFGLGILMRGDSGPREKVPVPLTPQYRPEVAGMLDGQLGAIAGGDQPLRRVMPKDEGGEPDGRYDGLQRARWHADDKALYLADAHLIEHERQGLDMPVRQKACPGR